MGGTISLASYENGRVLLPNKRQSLQGMNNSPELFGDLPKQVNKTDDKFLWDQFARLGEMIGDGLHNEPDGKWITKDYNRLSRILLPDMHKRLRMQKREAMDKQMAELLVKFKCNKEGCGGDLIQTRKGCKTAVCVKCGAGYKATKEKRNKGNG